MAKKKAAVDTIKCALCNAIVVSSEYAAHVQQFHAPAPPPPRAQFPVYVPPPGAPPPPALGGDFQHVTGPILAKDYSGGKYLKGSDVADGQNEITIRIIRFVLDPRGRSKLVAEIEPQLGKTLWGLNTTNIRALEALGVADLQSAVGRNIICAIGFAPNPQQNGALTKALFVRRVE